jgi:WD40 repeat protein
LAAWKSGVFGFRLKTVVVVVAVDSHSLFMEGSVTTKRSRVDDGPNVDETPLERLARGLCQRETVVIRNHATPTVSLAACVEDLLTNKSIDWSGSIDPSLQAGLDELARGGADATLKLMELLPMEIINQPTLWQFRDRYINYVVDKSTSLRKRMGLAAGVESVLNGPSSAGAVKELVGQIRDDVYKWFPAKFRGTSLVRWLRDHRAPFATASRTLGLTPRQADECWALSRFIADERWKIAATSVLCMPPERLFDNALTMVMGETWMGAPRLMQSRRSVMEMLMPRRRKLDIEVIASGARLPDVDITDATTVLEIWREVQKRVTDEQIKVWLDRDRTRMVSCVVNEMFTDLFPDVRTLFVDILPGVKTWTAVKQLDAPPDRTVDDVDFDADGRHILARYSDRFAVWDMRTDKIVKQMVVRSMGVGSFAHHGKHFIMPERNRWSVCDKDTMTRIKEIPFPPSTLTSHARGCVQWSPDGTMVALLEGKRIKILDANTLNVTHTFDPFASRDYRRRGAVVGASWSPDSARLAIILSRGQFVMWNIASDSRKYPLIHLPPNPSQAPINVSWGPDSRRLAVIRNHGPAEIWSTNGRRQNRLGQHISTVEWSPDGAFIAGSTRERQGLGKVFVWDAQTGDTVKVLKYPLLVPRQHHLGNTAFHTVHWNRDGTRLIAASDDKIVVFGSPQMNPVDIV